jgi:hypothetical protein
MVATTVISVRGAALRWLGSDKRLSRLCGRPLNDSKWKEEGKMELARVREIT